MAPVRVFDVQIDFYFQPLIQIVKQNIIFVILLVFKLISWQIFYQLIFQNQVAVRNYKIKDFWPVLEIYFIIFYFLNFPSFRDFEVKLVKCFAHFLVAVKGNIVLDQIPLKGNLFANLKIIIT